MLHAPFSTMPINRSGRPPNDQERTTLAYYLKRDKEYLVQLSENNSICTHHHSTKDGQIYPCDIRAATFVSNGTLWTIHKAKGPITLTET